VMNMNFREWLIGIAGVIIGAVINELIRKLMNGDFWRGKRERDKNLVLVALKEIDTIWSTEEIRDRALPKKDVKYVEELLIELQRTHPIQIVMNYMGEEPERCWTYKRAP